MSAALAAEQRVIAASERAPADYRPLFEACFELPFNEAWWRWKYRAVRNPSVALIEGDRIVAHYGGMPRRALMFGKPVDTVQVGDVMVHPSIRAGLGRRGPFYRMASTFLPREVGYDRPALIAFGFPNIRALRLGEALGLYAAVDHVTELRWAAMGSAVGGVRRIDPNDAMADTLIDDCWRQMQASLAASIVGVRDSGWWRARFVAHPTHRYSTWLLDAMRAAIVVRSHANALEWVDFIGPTSALPAARDAARAVAWASGEAEMFAWLSAGVAQLVRNADAREVNIEVAVPTCAYTPGPAAETLRGRWFLFGGDTDFR